MAVDGAGLDALCDKMVALDDVSVTEWRIHHEQNAHEKALLHSMTSVLLNGGTRRNLFCQLRKMLHSMTSVLLNGGGPATPSPRQSPVALDDVSVTEWRADTVFTQINDLVLHSMTSVLLNGGWTPRKGLRRRVRLHSMTSVLLNGGSSLSTELSSRLVALDDVSVTEWRIRHIVKIVRVNQLHSMTSVILNGGKMPASSLTPDRHVALDDVSVTEWRVAHSFTADEARRLLHSMTSVLFVPRKLNATGQQNKGKGLIPTPKADEAGTSLSAVRRLLFGLWSTGQSCSQGECI